MAVNVRGTADKVVERFVGVLETYAGTRPNVRIDIYRTDLGTVRVRILDPDFKGLDIEARENPVWEHLNGMPEDTLGWLGTLTLLTPQEAKKSIANMDFENPIPFPTAPRRRSQPR